MKRYQRFVTAIGAILACLVAASAGAVERGKLPFAADLTAEAKLSREKKIPIMILFSADGCTYCGRVRDEFFIPTTRNAEYDDKVILLEVEVGSGARLVDFQGKTTTQARFAQRYKIGFTPTVLVVDAAGKELTDPLIGLTTPDFYGGYMEDRIVQGMEKLRTNPR